MKNGTYEEAYENRGEAYYEIEEYDKWLEDLQKEIEVYDAILKVHSNDYKIYCKRGKAKRHIDDKKSNNGFYKINRHL